MNGQGLALPDDLKALVNSRRRALLGTGLTLSAGAVALLGGRHALAATAKGGDGEADVRILNTALGAELEAIAAYQVGAESGLLSAGIKTVALQFQGHHKEHADALAATVAKLGGKAVAAKATYAFPLEKLKSEQARVKQLQDEMKKISTLLKE